MTIFAIYVALLMSVHVTQPTILKPFFSPVSLQTLEAFFDCSFFDGVSLILLGFDLAFERCYLFLHPLYFSLEFGFILLA